jgi:hypothetical protein
MVVCDPLTHQYVFTHPPIETSDITILETKLLYREKHSFRFHLVFIVSPSHLLHPFSLVGSFRNGSFNWWTHTGSSPFVGDREIRVRGFGSALKGLRPFVRAGGKMFWAFPSKDNLSLVLDPPTLKFTLLKVPAGYSPLGETAGGGLCAGKLVDNRILICCNELSVDSDDPGTILAPPEGSWVFGEIPRVQDCLPWRSMYPDVYLRGIGPPCTGHVFMSTDEDGSWVYDTKSEKLQRLMTHDNLTWGYPLFPYFHTC